MDSYHDLLRDILENGEEHDDRTGVGAIRVFGRQWRHDMQDGFPLITTKEMFFRGVFLELKWFLSGSTHLQDLDKAVHKWWAPWADTDGSLGPIYGKQLRAHGPLAVDQLHCVLRDIMDSPDSRRIVMTTWDPSSVPDMKLPCCHGLVTQFCCHDDGGLSLSTYQRSADMFLGFPVNIASYALLLSLVAGVTGRYPRELVIFTGDTHLYKNHIPQVEEQLSRAPFSLPRLDVDIIEGESPEDALDKLVGVSWSDFELVDYHCYPKLPGDIAV